MLYKSLINTIVDYIVISRVSIAKYILARNVSNLYNTIVINIFILNKSFSIYLVYLIITSSFFSLFFLPLDKLSFLTIDLLLTFSKYLLALDLLSRGSYGLSNYSRSRGRGKKKLLRVGPL